MHKTQNLRVKTLKALITPALLAQELPLTSSITQTVTKARAEAVEIIQGRDDRLLVIVGPCSIHDVKAAHAYALKLKSVMAEYSAELCLVMRVYFEKPRTTIGWKGLINDPELDGSFHINRGLRLARELLLNINQMGVPTGSEFLDTTIPQYIADLTAWSAIGARTVESQVHRELASGLSMPVGFKNSTTGNIRVAADAVYAASFPHHFLGVSKDGVAAIVSTSGNADCHVILRGSSAGTNYDVASVNESVKLLAEVGLPQQVMIDCSHGNSRKDYRNQIHVATEVCTQIKSGSRHILGVMIESNLVAGKQEHKVGEKQNLVFGQSITDACVDWEETVKILKLFAEAVQIRRQQKGVRS